MIVLTKPKNTVSTVQGISAVKRELVGGNDARLARADLLADVQAQAYPLDWNPVASVFLRFLND
jgi:hypothetical protein